MEFKEILIIVLLGAVLLLVLVIARYYVSFKLKGNEVKIGSNDQKNDMEPRRGRFFLTKRANEYYLKKLEYDQLRIETEKNHEFLMYQATIDAALKGVEIQNGQIQAKPSQTRPLAARNTRWMDDYNKSA